MVKSSHCQHNSNDLHLSHFCSSKSPFFGCCHLCTLHSKDMSKISLHVKIFGIFTGYSHCKTMPQYFVPEISCWQIWRMFFIHSFTLSISTSIAQQTALQHGAGSTTYLSLLGPIYCWTFLSSHTRPRVYLQSCHQTDSVQPADLDCIPDKSTVSTH